MTTPTRRGLPDLGELEIEHGLRAISHDLTKKFTGRLSPETCDRFVHESYALMNRKAAVRVHLVALTRRFAWDRLTALDKVENAVATGILEVLFVCVHNAGRSQMAAALLAHHGQGRVVVRSAGSTPADEINPLVKKPSTRSACPCPTPTTNRSLMRSSKPPTSSSPWAAAMPAPSTPASGTSTGNSTTRPARPWRRSGPSATTSTTGSVPCSPSSYRRTDHQALLSGLANGLGLGLVSPKRWRSGRGRSQRAALRCWPLA